MKPRDVIVVAKPACQEGEGFVLYGWHRKVLGVAANHPEPVDEPSQEGVGLAELGIVMFRE